MLNMRTSLEDASGILLSLLRERDYHQVAGLDAVTLADKDFLLVTCCVVVIEHTLMRITRGDNKLALAGLEKLFDDIRIHLQKEKTNEASH